ncbi:hypothetical protein BDZ85DRAFT_285178 [Elsinoe ampelina]|uniref:Cortical protein marker for cell polarity-domain-containing protein n=1 Tax=Elsinoe ampelina TaxID=302913 RepID=A0A6A6G226_9PEZI|nr:hypothetical protein BDZ85DRAFT_285178 [Elsinoe ampelina]
MRAYQLFQSLALLATAVVAVPAGSDAFTTLVERTPGEELPGITLQPAVHWNVTTNKRKNIRANKQQTLYYAQNGAADPRAEHHFGTTKITYTVPAVNIDFDDAVNLDDVADVVTIRFSDTESFNIAQESWDGYADLLMMTYADICPDHDRGDYCYILAHTLTFDASSNTATGSADLVEPNDYIFAVDFEWGLYEPAAKAPAKALLKRQSDSAATACAATETVNGLPVATLGPGFDTRLDGCRGYEDASKTSFGAYVKSVGGDQSADDVVVESADKTLDGTSTLLNKTEAKDIANAAAEGQTDNPPRKAGSASALIPGINKPLAKEFEKKFSWSIPKDRGNAAGPWQKAKLLKEWKGQKTSGGNGKGAGGTSVDGSVRVYCVDCGASGSLRVYGKASWQLDSGFKEGIVQANLNLNVGFALGLDVQGVLKSGSKKEIAHVGLPGLSFGIITVGPWIELGADFSLTANAEGRLLAGARFIIQNAQATLDFAKKGRTGSSGWTPQFEPIFEASGQVAVAAEIGLPIGLTVGINILRGNLEAKAEFAASADATGASITQTDGCAGVATQVNFKNELFADILGKKFSLITPYVKSLTKGCIKIASSEPTDPSNPEEPASNYAPAMLASDASITSPKFNGYNTTAEGGTEYSELVDATKKFFLMGCPDGNLYLRPRSEEGQAANLTCSRVFQTSKNSLVGDGVSRLFHYYTDSMDKLGVSRLRLHKDNQMPKGSEFVNFYAFSNTTGSLSADENVNDSPKGTKAYYLAQDRNKNQFYAVLCSFDDPGKNPAKVFLAKDADKGPEILMGEAVRESITGGIANGCYALPFMQAPKEAGNDWNNQWGANQNSVGANSTSSSTSSTTSVDSSASTTSSEAAV